MVASATSGPLLAIRQAARRWGLWVPVPGCLAPSAHWAKKRLEVLGSSPWLFESLLAGRTAGELIVRPGGPSPQGANQTECRGTDACTWKHPKQGEDSGQNKTLQEGRDAPMLPGAHNELTSQPTRGKEPAPLRQLAAKRQSQVPCTQWFTSSLGPQPAGCQQPMGCLHPTGRTRAARDSTGWTEERFEGPLRSCLTQD